MDWLKVILLGYLLGSIPFGYIAGKMYKIDVRNYGSGNIGFTNVMRVIGIMPATVVLFFDALKGFLAVYYGYLLGNEVLAVIGALASMLGHIWPFTLKFKGGRGVATGLGISLFLSIKITMIAVFIWLTIVLLTRYVSLGSIVAAIFMPLAMIIVGKPLPYIVFTFLGATIVLVRHTSNIKRLLQGKENKLGKKIIITPKGGQ